MINVYLKKMVHDNESVEFHLKVTSDTTYKVRLVHWS